MAEVGIAHLAGGFDAVHAIRVVVVVGHHTLRNGAGIAGPARAGVSFAAAGGQT